MENLTLYELAAQYRHGAQLLAGRIKELTLRRNKTQDPTQRLLLDGRLAPLIEMRRQAQQTARECEHYYKGGVSHDPAPLPAWTALQP